MTDKKYTAAGLIVNQIHYWIERHRPDGFDDNKTYVENLDDIKEVYYNNCNKWREQSELLINALQKVLTCEPSCKCEERMLIRKYWTMNQKGI